MVPRMTGRELIAIPRQEAQEDLHIPIILMSVAGTANLADTDADAVLPKPFDITQVEDLLRHFLGKVAG